MVDTVEIPALNERQLARLQSASRENIAFDDLGNAVWQFAPDEETSVDAAARPVRMLDHPALSLVEEEPPASETIRTNMKGLQTGYNPYDSGQLARKAGRKPRDMRELSRWIELRKKLGADK